MNMNLYLYLDWKLRVRVESAPTRERRPIATAASRGSSGAQRRTSQRALRRGGARSRHRRRVARRAPPRFYHCGRRAQVEQREPPAEARARSTCGEGPRAPTRVTRPEHRSTRVRIFSLEKKALQQLRMEYLQDASRGHFEKSSIQSDGHLLAPSTNFREQSSTLFKEQNLMHSYSNSSLFLVMSYSFKYQVPYRT